MSQNLPGKAPQNKKFLAAEMIYFDADTAVNDAFNEYVRKKAHYIWKKKGMPEGQDKEILIKAEEEGKKVFKPKRKQQEDTTAISAPELDNGFSPQEMTKRINKLESAYADLLDTVKKIDGSRDASQLKNSGAQPVQSEGEIQPADYIRKLELERDTLREELIVLTGKYSHACLEFEKKKEALNKEITGLISEKQSLSSKVAFMEEEQRMLKDNITRLERMKNAVYLTKEREGSESKIIQLQQENSSLLQKVSEAETNLEKQRQSLHALESKVKAMVYLDKKNEMLQEELSTANSEKENLRKGMEETKQKNTDLTAKLVSLEKEMNKMPGWEKEASKLKDIIGELNEERSELLKKISLLEKENNDILSRKKEKPCDPEQSESQKNLICKIKEMEQERLQLFKTVRDMEEEKRIIPYLDQKCMVYEEEMKRSEAEKNSMEILIKRFEKERKEMAEKIIMLEEKRNFRFELEQEKGMLQKKILELEEERSKLLHSLSGLEDTLVSGQDKRPRMDGLKAEFEKIAAENTALREKLKDASSLSFEYSNQQKVIGDLEQELNNKLQQLSQMREREKELLLQISEVTQRQKAPYILDRKKLEELKDFTLEAIQARRWKNPEFVNGAYDAIGLFYRTILSDEPVKKQSAEDVPE